MSPRECGSQNCFARAALAPPLPFLLRHCLPGCRAVRYTYTNDHFGIFWDFCDIAASPLEDRIVHGVCGRLATELALLEEVVMEDHPVPINKNENEGIAVLPLVSFLSHRISSGLR